MKYSAGTVTIDGETHWAVRAGRKYFPATATTSQAEAEKSARIMSMRWYYEQAEKIGDGLVEEFGDVGHWRDYMC